MLEAVQMCNVKAAGLIGERIDLTWEKNILKLAIDHDFIAPFKKKQEEKGYIGMGKLMDTLVNYAYYTQDNSLFDLKEHVFSEIIGAQISDGYIGMFNPDKRVSKLWDIHEISYIIFGLVSDYRYFKDVRSLEAGKKAADFLLARVSSSIQFEHSLILATLGFDRALLALYSVTGDNKYMDFCMKECQLPNWDLDIVEGRHGKIFGHIYAFLSRCLTQLELYQIHEDERLFSQTRKAFEYLTKRGGLVITGSSGIAECWDSEQIGEGNMGETCATAYLIRLLDTLIRLEGLAYYGDMMERAIYNALFAAQSPDGRKIRYYTPFEGKRIYFDRDTYCCPNNFRRIVSELPKMIYYKSQSGLFVNLYTTSSMKTELFQDISLSLSQETDYPNSGTVCIYVDPSKTTRFPIYLRKPRWCSSFSLMVNGKAMAPKSINDFLVIKRDWKRGDKILLEWEMKFRLVKGFRRQNGRAAVMRGPILFCINPVRNGMISETDLKSIIIHLDTISEPVPDNKLRHNGIICRAKGSISGEKPETGGERNLILTEFPDPDGKMTYFRVSDISTLVDDELVEHESVR